MRSPDTSSADSDRMARALYRSCEIPGAAAPYDRASLKIFYPAMPDDGVEQRNAGLVPVDRSATPCPVVIIMPGINVGPEAYTWLAAELSRRGMIAVTYTLVAEEMPGYISLTPGLDLSAITPKTYGTRTSATAIGAIINALRQENAEGPLQDCIDVEKTVIAGHSAGGSVALYNAHPGWFPEVRGAIAFAAHAAASTALGFAENTVLALPDALPILLIGGTRDGVIKSSAHRYGDGENGPDRLQQTFDESIVSNRDDSYLVMIDGANHFSIAWPVDESSGRHFLDETEQGDGTAIRSLIADLFETFVGDAINGTNNMGSFADSELVASFQRR